MRQVFRFVVGSAGVGTDSQTAADRGAVKCEGLARRMQEVTVIATDIAAHDGVDEAYFAIGVESIAEIHLAADVHQIGVESIRVGRRDEPSAVAVEVAADMSAAELDAAIRAKLASKYHVAADVGAAGIDGRLATADKASVAARDTAPDFGVDETHLAESTELVAEAYIAADLGVVKIECDAALGHVGGRGAMECESAAEIEVAADLGIDEIEAAENSGGKQINVLGDLDAAGFHGGRTAIADVELLELGMANVDAVAEQAIVERQREGDVRAVEVELAFDGAPRSHTPRLGTSFAAVASVQSQTSRSALSLGLVAQDEGSEEL